MKQPVHKKASVRHSPRCTPPAPKTVSVKHVTLQRHEVLHVKLPKHHVAVVVHDRRKHVAVMKPVKQESWFEKIFG